MSGALLAAAAAVSAVVAVWEGLAAAEALVPVHALGRILAPLARIRREGREPSVPERRRLALVGTAGLFASGWLLAGPLLGAALAMSGPWALTALVRHRRRRHRAELERQAPAVARAIADALGAGHAIPAAIVEAARGSSGPIAAELAAVARAMVLGEHAEAALGRLCARAQSRCYDVLVAAILLQRDAGGDLATLLRELAAAQEEAARLLADARAATAQARFTGLVVAVLPAGAAGLAELASPGSLAGILRVPLAAWLAGFAVLLQAAGFVAIRRLARVTS
jgi:tight adherence protein B